MSKASEVLSILRIQLEALPSYVKLVKVANEAQANKVAKEMGFGSHKDLKEKVGQSIVGWFVDVDEKVRKLPKGVKEGEVKPILVIVHNRPFSEKAAGYLSKNGKEAFVLGDDFEDLF